MSYTTVNYPTKKAMKEAVAAGTAYVKPDFISGKAPCGTAYIEGPHYPKPHTWYAAVIVDDANKITKVKS